MKWQLGESYQEVTSLRGVELDANGHVTDINLAANNVAEDILPDVLQLPQVAYIDISNNDIGCNLDDLLGEGQVLNVQKTSVPCSEWPTITMKVTLEPSHRCCPT